MADFNQLVRPVASPVEQATALAQLKGLAQQNQSGAIALKKQQQMDADRAVVMQAQAEAQGDSRKWLPALVGKVSPKTYNALAMSDAQTREQLGKAKKEELDLLNGRNGQFSGFINQVANLPDDQFESAQPQIKAAFKQFHPEYQDDGQPITKQELQAASIGTQNLDQYIKQAGETQAAALRPFQQKEQEAKTAKEQYEALRAKRENDLGVVSPQAAESEYRALNEKEMSGHKLTAAEQLRKKSYEKSKLLVPATSANIRMEGLGKIRQFPVYDNTTKTTVYMDSNEINDAKLREPGRYTVPQFTAEALIQQGTGKSFAPGGKAGEEVLAFNTAAQHAELLSKASEALANNDVRLWNSLKNRLQTEFGASGPMTFQTIANAYARETTKALSAGHITNQEINTQGATLPSNASPQQLKDVIGAYKALMDSKLSLRKQQQSAGAKGQVNYSNAQPIYATNPQTKQRIMSNDGGQTWQPAQ